MKSGSSLLVGSPGLCVAERSSGKRMCIDCIEAALTADTDAGEIEVSTTTAAVQVSCSGVTPQPHKRRQLRSWPCKPLAAPMRLFAFCHMQVRRCCVTGCSLLSCCHVDRQQSNLQACISVSPVCVTESCHKVLVGLVV